MTHQSQTNPAALIAATLTDLDIAVSHTQASLDEASHWLINPGLDDPLLSDWTTQPFVTIDNPDSRDLDQALLIERHNAGFRVRYALADASYYIRPNSALFTEALSRGTTYYTPTMAAAMLPETLSEDLISLNPNVDRRALVFDMIVDATDTVCSTSVVRAKIRSQAKLSYGAVQAWLDSDADSVLPYDESLRLLEELGIKLIEAAARRGVINFDRTETRVLVTGEPPHFDASVRKRYNTERYNEQISLMCNMQGADMLQALASNLAKNPDRVQNTDSPTMDLKNDSAGDSTNATTNSSTNSASAPRNSGREAFPADSPAGVAGTTQAIFRVHDAPLKKSLKNLQSLIAAFAEQQDQPALWQWHNDQTLADYVQKLPTQLVHKRLVRTIQRQIMQAQRASVFRVDAGIHHALKAASYARFSSPMREVVGIFTHKELIEALHGKHADNEADIQLREAVIESANSARQRQRKLDKLIEYEVLRSVFREELASNDVPWHDGTLIGMRRDKFYISLDDMAIDVKLYKENLETQFATRYTFTDIKALPEETAHPHWHLGQGVKLRFRAFDTARKRFDFIISSVN